MNKSEEEDKEFIEKLLRMVKREVKQIMEEAVTRKFIHEDSGSITSLCATVDACLSHGLKRRALGLFKTNSTTALLQKVAKNCECAAIVLKKVNDIENSDPNKRSSSSSDSLNRTRMSFKIKSNTSTGSISNNTNTTGNNNAPSSPTKNRYLWIRIALFEKYLVSIVDHVVQNSSKYYERDALVADPVAGQILASLLVGPCALDYTKMKTQDQFWNDPPADELVQRHRISSSIGTPSPPTLNQSTPPLGRKPLGMNYKKCFVFSNGTDEDHASSASPISRTSNFCWSPRDYVESLHQNSKSTLLYGKNNVVMQPMDDQEPMPGYLSLHQDQHGLIIKWTPNQLINGRVNQTETGENISNHSIEKMNNFWSYALNVNVENIVYLHCHQQKHDCGSIVMVGRDGVMHPPIKFPKGGHLLAFLSCLENGLVPYGQLDPPLWSEKGKGIAYGTCYTYKVKLKTGKIFPKLRRKGRSLNNSLEESMDDSEETAADYVFRVISICDKPDTISPEMLEPKSTNYATDAKATSSVTYDAMSESNSFSICQNNDSNDLDRDGKDNTDSSDKRNLQILCDTMKKQIISRAFYGWLAYCRHLKTVRTHLADLVNSKIYRIDEPTDASKGITVDLWDQIQTENGPINIDPMEFYRLIYYGGIEHSIRRKVWLYLYEHYNLKDTNEDKKLHDLEIRQKYEMIMSEWLAVEAIVRQRDKEIVAANLAKLSSESNNDSTEMSMDKSMFQSTCKMLMNEVFDDIEEFSTPLGSRKSSNHSDRNKINKSCSDIQRLAEQISEECIKKFNGVANNHPSKSRNPLLRNPKLESLASLSGTGIQNILITNPSVDRVVTSNSLDLSNSNENNANTNEDPNTRLPVNSMESANSQCVSPASSNGGLYSNELLDSFSLNLHRIDKDVQRCDRNYCYFTKENLEKLRNVMCTYVWDHLEIGYVQGMCDLVAPLLVIFDDEVYTYSCFCKLMIRMTSNFPHGGAMDRHFANMRSLIQILDSDIFELMHQNGDYTHFYFCYRWFLLDFKRELIYADVFSVWETIWAAKYVSSSSFVLFIALALVEYYRDIILENNMDFTDIIKFFNEMAERHDAKAVLNIARDLVHQIQTLMENK